MNMPSESEEKRPNEMNNLFVEKIFHCSRCFGAAVFTSTFDRHWYSIYAIECIVLKDDNTEYEKNL